MASKYAVKTYSRSYGRENAASRAFDDVVSNKQGDPVSKANTKWGKTSFSRNRGEDPFETTLHKVKVEVETEDPFSFALDEDTKKGSKVEDPVSISSGLGRPAIPNVKAVKKPSYGDEPKKEEPEEIADFDTQSVNFKRPVRTYSRSSKKQQNVDLDRPSDDNDGMPVLEPEDGGGYSGFDIIDTPPRRNPGFHETIDTSEDPYSQDIENDEDPISQTNKQGRKNAKKGKNARVAPIARISSKTHVLQSDDDENSSATVLNFRSHFMDPAVYSRFNYVPRQEDPVGRLNNSKVLQKSEIKHGKGSTLIVICSPKPVSGGDKSRPAKDSITTSQTARESSGHATRSETKRASKQASNIPTPEASDSAAESTPTSSELPQTSQKSTDSSEEFGEETPTPQYTRQAVKRSAEPEKSVRYNKIFRSRNPAPPPSQQKEQEQILEDEEKKVRDVNNENPDTAAQDRAPVRKTKRRRKDVDTAFGFDEGSGSDESMEEEMDQEKPQEEEQGDAMEVIEEINLDDTQEEEQGVVMEGTEEIAVDDTQESREDREQSGESQSECEEEMSQGIEDSLVSSQGSSGLDSSQETGPNINNNASSREKKIFKSKNKAHSLQRKIFQSPKKSPSKAVYNVRSWHADFDEEDRNKSKGDDTAGPPKLQPVTKVVPKFDDDKSHPKEPPKLSRAVHWPDKLGDEAYTSVHVTKEHKELFTVVRNVKEAHQCQEYGETQEFSDDVEYLLTGLQEGEPMSTRCLSCVGLAQKCIMPAFRMHLRAHGTVAKIFGCLQDACTDPSLALCTALLMFMLSRDRLNMDLDRQSLDLMLKLLGIDNQEQLSATMTATGKRALNRNKDRVKEVYDQLQQESGTKQSLESVSTGNLAMESLLSLTSRRAGEWFKEELRALGALDHIVDTVCSCIEAVGDDTTLLTDSTIENLKKIDRCLRVLENVTFVNTENQMYLISYKQGMLVTSICRALYTCEQCLPVYPVVDSEKIDKDSTGYVVYSCVLAILRVLLNLTHDNEFGSTKTGQQHDFICTVLTCILQTPQFVPLDMRFDLLVLSLGLMINMVEHCDVNRRRLIDAKVGPAYEFEKHNASQIPAPKALVQVFCHRYEVAKKMEEQDFGEPATPQSSPNKSGEWKESDSGIEWVINSAKKSDKEEEEKESPKVQDKGQNSSDVNDDKKDNLDDEETFTKALHRAGKHMENSIVASYVALLLGCVIQDNTMFVDDVKQHLPKGNFDDMITILKKFLGFMNLTTAIGSSGGKSIAHVIEVLEGC